MTIPDNHSQIRIRRIRESGLTYYEVSLGFYVTRGKRRVWFTEGVYASHRKVGYYDTLVAARRAATDPRWVAERDLIRRRRGDPPAEVPYTMA